MNLKTLGNSNLSLTELGFGGAPIGNMYSEVTHEDAVDSISAAWQRGIRYFDTAPHYGLGLSEQRLGEVLDSHQRSEYVISTKVGRLLRTNPQPSGSDLAAGGFAVNDDLIRVVDYSSKGVRQSLEESLVRLKTSYIDVVYVHDPDDYVDLVLNETIPALVEMRDEHLIGAIGAGMNDWRPLRRFVEESDIDVVMLAGRWSLLDQSGAPLLDACVLRGVSVVAAAPFNSGILSTNIPDSHQNFDYQSVTPERLEKATALAKICRQHGIDLPHAAICFPLRHEAVVAVVVGMRNSREVISDVNWVETPLPTELWDELAHFENNWRPE